MYDSRFTCIILYDTTMHNAQNVQCAMQDASRVVRAALCTLHEQLAIAVMQQATSHKYNLLCTSLWPVSLHSPAVVRRSFTQKLSVVHQQKRQETLPLLILK